MITNHNSQNIHTSDVQNYKYIIYTDTYVQEVYDIWYWTSFSNHAIRMSQDPCLFHVIFSVAQIHNAPAPVSFGYAPPPPFSAIHSSLEKFHMKFPSTELSGNCHEERMMKIMDEISQDRELWYYILIYIYIYIMICYVPPLSSPVHHPVSSNSGWVLGCCSTALKCRPCITSRRSVNWLEYSWWKKSCTSW